MNPLCPLIMLTVNNDCPYKCSDFRVVYIKIIHKGGESMYEELFYKRLTQLRLQKGVSARDMSLTLGQSSGYINKLVNKQDASSMMVFFLFVLLQYFSEGVL